ncbi:putative methyltransferase DDB_G0268948 [Denticeps clupeoides]|uniref:Methyltransferase type 11 domain-containing protein n=1 Tax=Denticeps clupeoides TaxID=299321 RepID=A0AAY4EWA0_9TELE|nr:putative methyltransferase DDB_G0268948 [Denticeps clupeoides]XP_028819689.1 putative methyltransferase DDB_G0268948 [Denticeps clupeoides]
MAVRLFEGREHVSNYWKYRICPSEELIGKVLTFLRRNKDLPWELAVDVGCGSGQGTVLLAPHFTKVEGTDISPAQVEEAQKHVTAQNISYRQGPAEELPFPDGSVDLVTAMSAFHWFDHPRFLRESDRILKPGGCLALLNYTMDMELSYSNCSAELNQIIKEFYDAILPFRNPYLGSGSPKLYTRTYESLEYPVKEWHECEWVKKRVTLSGFIGMLETFSTYQALQQKDSEYAERLSRETTQRLLKVMNVTSPETEVEMAVRYFCLFACKPSCA